jgi:ATPase subunit of ABC transporter with duplicated ATPase domains
VSTVVLEDLSLSFGKKRIVEGLDLRIAEGDRIGLIGANGTGKSTLMKILAGLLEPDHGSVRRTRGLRVGYLSQDIELDVDRTLLAYPRARDRRNTGGIGPSGGRG